ncbi:hypothetical protein BROUX41_003566 [Berkeleyomyces rouxiae]
MKAILRKEFTAHSLLPFQLGVGSPLGVEPAVFLLNKVAAGSTGYTHVTSLDFKNAFNSVSRLAVAQATERHCPNMFRAARWAYNEPAALILGDKTALISSEGVRQGDPLGPYLFSLAISDTVDSIRAALVRNHRSGPPPLVIAYLDDIYVFSNNADAIAVVQDTLDAAGSPIELNPGKCLTRSVADIQASGFSCLGSLVGPIAARRQFLWEKVCEVGKVLDLLTKQSRQAALLLLRGSTAHRIRHLLRTLDPNGVTPTFGLADSAILDFLRYLRSDSTRLSTDELIKELPISLGGLGLPSMEKLARPSFEVARTGCEEILRQIFPAQAHLFNSPPAQHTTQKEVARAVAKADLEAHLPALGSTGANLLKDNAGFYASKWLTAAPTSFALVLSDREVTFGLKGRFLVPYDHQQHQGSFSFKHPAARFVTSAARAIPTSTPSGLLQRRQPVPCVENNLNVPELALSPCAACGKPLFTNHEQFCSLMNKGFIRRHDKISKVLCNSLKSQGVNASYEPSLMGRAHIRPDIAVEIDGVTSTYDVTVIAADARGRDLHTRLADAHQDKMRKYPSAYGPNFHPLVFSAAGRMEQRSAPVMSKLQKLLGPCKDFVDAFISMALLRTRANTRCEVEQKNELRLPFHAATTATNPEPSQASDALRRSSPGASPFVMFG